MKNWILRRQGMFEAKPIGGNHCGLGQMKFRYECFVTCSKLDAQGFVIDNLLINDCAQTAEIAQSCELYGEKIATTVFNKIPAAMRSAVTEIKVTVGVVDLPGADATFVWTNPSEVIPRPMRAIRKTGRTRVGSMAGSKR